MPEIGETLREARMRERIDISEIEAKTKIRARYLRALENEEWDLLPGPTFVKSFLRTYADALGLDGKALVEEYRKSAEPPSEPIEPISSSRRMRVPTNGASRGYMVLIGAVAVLVVLLIVGLVSSGGKSSNKATSARARTASKGGRHGATSRSGAQLGASPLVSVSMLATGTVYVCLIGEGGRKLVAGETLEPGTRTATFRARRFELTLGNNAVTLLIDGVPRLVPASNTAIGYVITKAGRRPLAPGRLPTCA
jgi:transcriptional regulator with XRE-family HTH domain